MIFYGKNYFLCAALKSLGALRESNASRHPPVVARPESTQNKSAATLRHEFIYLSESEIMGWFDGEILN